MAAELRDPRPFPLLQWFTGLALCTVILFAGALNILLELRAGVFPVLLTTLAAFSVVPFYTLLILALDRHEREPGWLLLAAFFWGAAVATLFAGIANMLLHFLFDAILGPKLAAMLGPPLAGPLTEETAKGLVVLLIANLAWKRERTLITSYLQEEPDDVVRKDELPLLLSPLRRLRVLWEVLGKSGIRRWADQRALFDLLADFAFAKHDVAEGRRTAAELDRYRTRIRELRRRLGSAAGAHEGNVP